MKNLFLILATVISFSTLSFASNIGDGSLAIVKSERVELSLESEGQKEFILSSSFNIEEENISMNFVSEVSTVQIFNKEGELEMMFPIGSTKVNLGMSLFEDGDYRMGFVVEGMDDIQFTNLTVK